MTYLNDFPTEVSFVRSSLTKSSLIVNFQLLVIVLTKLDQGDRLKCKLVCKRWLMILMTHKKFFKDRHLCLTDCLIKKETIPGSILQNIKYPYEVLTLDHNIRCLKDPEEIHWLYDTIGQDVTVLKFIGYFDVKVWKVVSCFRNLQKLNLIDTTITQMIRSYITFKDLEQKVFALPEVEVIKENSFQIEENTERASILATVFPKLTKIISAGVVFTSVDAYVRAMEMNMFKEGITYDYRKNEILQELLMNSGSSPNFYLRKVNFNRGEIKTDKDLTFVIEMCKKYSSIQKVSMWFNGVPKINCDLVTNLSIKLSSVKTNEIRSLRKLIGLKKLTLYISTIPDQCLNWHDNICHKGVKTLTIHSGDLNCAKCYLNCIRSFPKVIEFVHYITEPVAKALMGQIITFPVSTFPNLRKFVIESENSLKYSYRLQDELSSYVGTHPHLKHLILKNMTDVTKKDLKRISKIFPNISNLSLDLSTKLTAYELVESLSKTIRSLKHFNLQTKYPQKSDYDKHEELENIVRKVVENGANLRTLALPTFKRIEKTCFVNLLFSELNQLNYIIFGIYRSYYRSYYLSQQSH